MVAVIGRIALQPHTHSRVHRLWLQGLGDGSKGRVYRGTASLSAAQKARVVELMEQMLAKNPALQVRCGLGCCALVQADWAAAQAQAQRMHCGWSACAHVCGLQSLKLCCRSLLWYLCLCPQHALDERGHLHLDTTKLTRHPEGTDILDLFEQVRVCGQCTINTLGE